MPLYTEHLNLAKPNRDERYNIAVPNGNMDILDETIQALREELAGKVDINQSPTVYSLELADDYQLAGQHIQNCYYKLPSNIVNVYFWVRKKNGAALAQADALFELPAGFRPSFMIYGMATMYDHESTVAWPAQAVIREDGICRIYRVEPTDTTMMGRVAGSLTFLSM